ncbi:MAG: ubiquitin carboxyl-terminal hydrolase family protein [Candidatus Babeliales bacterium]
MRITTQHTAIISIVFLISGTVMPAQKKPKLPPKPPQQTLISLKIYQRELQTAQREQARLAWQIGALPPIDVTFFTDFFSETKQYLENSRWISEQRPTPIPLQNLGYTCSFNALTQVLWRLAPLNLALIRSTEPRTPLINEYLRSITQKNAAPANASMNVKNLIDILNALNKGTPLADPLEIWQLFTQQWPKNVCELFNVGMQDTVYCPTEAHGSDIKIFPYPYINIPVINTQKNDLQDMLNNVANKEIIEQVSTECNVIVDNNACGLQKYKKSKILTQQPPALLVIHTERGTREKIKDKTTLHQDPVTFPLSNLKFGETVYDLFGVVFHQGVSVEDGHYYSWVRQQDNSWYYCSDTAIKKIDLSKSLPRDASMQTFVFFYLCKKE